MDGPHACATLSALLSVAHAAEEVFGRGGPLWEALGRAAGVRAPRTAGFFLVAAALPGSLAYLAWAGYAGGSPVALSALWGARLGDAAFSHFGPDGAGLVRPNPGTYTAYLYLAEGLALVLAWGPFPSLPGALAALGFLLVIPALWLAGKAGLLPRR